ncbi:proteoglycan 4b [Salminus brasiliensis]|uniref:proteoglycan 4b n=1 Tax=Salminus brasiliensis TaxID=930266 RepID=UPI003B8399C3
MVWDTAEMSSTSFLLLLACVFFTCSSAQKSCRGRCGEDYNRGDKCHCDYECLSHNECCKNFESVCTTGDSCKGRCGEGFKRGRQCHCDIECVKFNQCCPDYETQCTLEECSTEEETDDPEVTTLSNSETSPAAEEDYDPEEEAITDTTPRPEVARDSESVPTDVPEDKLLEPTVPEHPLTPIPTGVETEINDTVKASPELSETEESSSSLPEELSPPEPSTNISSIPPATEATTETTGKKDPPVPEEDLDASGSEVLSTSSSAPTLPPEETPTLPNNNQTPTDLPSAPTSPAHEAHPNITSASEQPEQPDQNQNLTNPESTLETTAIPTTTALPDLEISASNSTEPEPSNPTQPEDTLAPANTPGPETDQSQSEPTENEPPKGVEPNNLNPTEKPSTPETTKAQENTKDPPTTKDSSITPVSVKGDIEKPTKPKSDGKDVLDGGNPQDYQADANNDTNLCSGRPVNGLTTLRNGTIMVFRGHYFWMLDSRRNPGPPLGITDVWGIPSPIDTVFTRCNCQGKTYFFKGNDYWRFENDVMDPGFPKPVSAGFGLGGQITAALSMPQYRSRKESVFFFKRGGLAQRYSYRITPQCGRNLAVYTTKKKVKRQAEPELGQEIDIRKSWRGFPTMVSSAVSVASTGGDGYKYYIFSRTKYYSLKMEGDTPVILTPRGGPGKQKPAKSWFRCPENR